MKVALAISSAGLIACSVPDESSKFVCDGNDDCSDGRVCDTSVGYCVVRSMPGADGEPDAPGASPRCEQWTPPVHFAPCEIPLPLGPLALDTAGVYLLDTTNGTLTGPNTPPVASGNVDGAGFCHQLLESNYENNITERQVTVP